MFRLVLSGDQCSVMHVARTYEASRYMLAQQRNPSQVRGVACSEHTSGIAYVQSGCRRLAETGREHETVMVRRAGEEVFADDLTAIIDCRRHRRLTRRNIDCGVNAIAVAEHKDRPAKRGLVMANNLAAIVNAVRAGAVPAQRIIDGRVDALAIEEAARTVGRSCDVVPNDLPSIIDPGGHGEMTGRQRVIECGERPVAVEKAVYTQWRRCRCRQFRPGHLSRWAWCRMCQGGHRS